MPVSPATDNLSSLLLSSTSFIDVRAPVEFARGAMPGALDLPLLDDRQRELVGTRFRQAGQAAAIALGNSMVTPEIKQSRIAAWQQAIEANPTAVLYCFRGGLRSQISQQWLAESGISITRVAGGYKSMRQYLLDEIEISTQQLPIMVLGGRTGTGKTHLLKRLQRFIDLEGLARHRGSSFGRLTGKQPTNADFENELAQTMLRQRLTGSDSRSESDIITDKHCTPVYLEDEAKLIGRVALPQTLKDQMAVAPMVLLEETMQRRVEVARTDYIDELLEDYQAQSGVEAGFEQWAEQHRQSLHRIRKRLGGVAFARASELLECAVKVHKSEGNTECYDDFIEFLLSNYYDPMYDYQLQQKNRPVLFRGPADALYEWAQNAENHFAAFSSKCPVAST